MQRAAPDGHTLLYTIATHVQLPHLYKNPPWNVFTDFTPITAGGRGATVLTAHISAPFNNIAELVAYAKANPGKLNYASFGTGTTSHLNGALFARRAGIDLVHIPYRGSGEAMKDHLAGVVELFFDGPTTAISNVASGRVKLIAAAAETRISALPDLPTMREQGYDVGIYGSGVRPGRRLRSSRRSTATSRRRSKAQRSGNCSPRAARKHLAFRRPRWCAKSNAFQSAGVLSSARSGWRWSLSPTITIDFVNQTLGR